MILDIIAKANKLKANHHRKDTTYYQHRPINVDDIKFVVQAIKELKYSIDDVLEMFNQFHIMNCKGESYENII